MRQLLLISTFLACSVISGFSQTTQECPTISVSRQSGIVNLGKIATYIANVDTKGRQLSLEYNWSVNAGTIVAGQGTTRLEVEMPDQQYLTVTVEISGFPNGCPAVASETSEDGLSKPLEVKLGQLAGPITEAARIVLDEAVDVLNKEPNAQLFILSGRIGGKQSDGVLANENGVLNHLESKGLERSRVTIVGVYAEHEMLQFWKVPPGADIPRCEECEALENAAKAKNCPSISVIGPAGITSPGEVATFSLLIKGSIPDGIQYVWTTTGGEIVGGQGTTSIGVMFQAPPIGASVKILGLPQGCSETVSERYDFAIDPGPLELGMISGPAYRIDDNFLNRIVSTLSEHRDAQLYVILYFDSSNAKSSAQSFRKKLTARFVKHGIDSRTLTFVTSSGPAHMAVIWLVPPGVSAPPS